MMNYKRKAETALCDHNDRFNPRRSLTRHDLSIDDLKMENEIENNMNSMNIGSPGEQVYVNKLKETLGMNKKRLLCFQNKPIAPKRDFLNNEFDLGEKIAKKEAKSYRYVSSAPERVLDAPGLVNDFYLNLVDWSADGTLGIALNDAMYLYNTDDATIKELCTLNEDEGHFTAVKFDNSTGGFVALGTDFGSNYLFDAASQERIRALKGHSDRCHVFDWNVSLLSSAGRDGLVLVHDIRQKNHIINEFEGHVGEVLSLKWDLAGNLLASGGDDGRICLFDVRKNKTLATFEGHSAAVKGLAWNPHCPNILCSGGGQKDQKVKLWNTSTGKQISERFVGDAVSSIMFNDFGNDFVASVGSNVCLFTYPDVLRVTKLKGHDQRVLGLSKSPCGSSVCSIGADETLRFWKVFQEPEKKSKCFTPPGFSTAVR